MDCSDVCSGLNEVCCVSQWGMQRLKVGCALGPLNGTVGDSEVCCGSLRFESYWGVLCTSINFAVGPSEVRV